MAANIEWVIEELEGPDTDPETLEIVNVDHADTYREALNRAAGLEHYRIGLVRDAQSGRSWAYVVNDRLPDSFLDAYGEETVATPARYRAQVELATAAASDFGGKTTEALTTVAGAMVEMAKATTVLAATATTLAEAMDAIPAWRVLFRRNRRSWLSYGVFSEAGEVSASDVCIALEAQGYQAALRPANAAARDLSL